MNGRPYRVSRAISLTVPTTPDESYGLLFYAATAVSVHMIGFQSARLLAQQSGGVRTLWHIIDSFSMSHFYGSVSSCRSVLTVPNQCDDDDNFLKLKYKPKQKNGPTEAPVKAPPRCPRGHRWRTADFHRLHTVRIKNIKKTDRIRRRSRARRQLSQPAGRHGIVKTKKKMFNSS